MANRNQAGRAQRTGHRRPAHQWGHGAGRSADDDVLRRWSASATSCRPARRSAARRWRVPRRAGWWWPTTRRTLRCRASRRTPRAWPGVTRSVGSGRPLVRRITRSMSRSSTWLMVLAPAADRVPPNRVATINHEPGPALGRHDHRRDGGDQEQLDDAGLGQLDVGADAVPDGDHRPRVGDPGILMAHGVPAPTATRLRRTTTSARLLGGDHRTPNTIHTIHSVSASSRCSTWVSTGVSRAMLTTPMANCIAR